MNKKENKIKTITQISIMAALASSIGILDKVISSSIFPLLPGIKIGIANIIILIGLYIHSFKEALLIEVIKITIVNFLFGGITSVLIGGTAAMISFLIMYLIYKKYKNNICIVTISIIGGFVHINIQLIVISLLYDIGKEIYIYGSLLIILSLITSIIIGAITKKIIKYISKKAS